MKRASLILLATALCGFARGQELQVPDPQPADSVIQLNYSDGLHQVQRELTLLTDPATDWWLGPRDNALSGYVEQKSWLVGVDAATFLRDAAFSLPYTRGYTATGFFVTPYAKHRIGRNAQMTFGVHLAGAAGSNGIRLLKPLVRLEYKPHDNVRLVMGSLYGALTHKLFEPMLDRERYVYDHYEEGVQILAQLPLGGRMGLITDTWLHWEELLEE